MKKKKIPMRKCIISQEMFPKKSLIRIVRTPENEVLIDPTGKKSGRGAYVCAKTEYIDLAQKKKSLERVFQTKIEPSLYDQLREYAKGVQHEE